MAEKLLDAYLNDHLGGATGGVDLAEQLRDQTKGTPFGETMATLAAEIKADRATLADIMSKMGTAESPVKQAGAWVMGKLGEAKFSGFTTGSGEFGTFLAIEALEMGVGGKECLWRALREVKDANSVLSGVDFDDLIERAESQQGTLETARLEYARSALTESSQVSA